MESINISSKAKQVIDYSDLGIECGYLFNPVGNFSIIPFGDYYLASFRAFGYYITSDIHKYVFTQNMRLKEPHKYIFCLLDREFKFVKQLKCVQSSYWEHPVWNKRLPYLEDMRMTIWNGQIYGMSTIIYQDEKKYALLGLELQKIDFLNGGIVATHQWNSVQQGIGGIQKNWLPVEGRPFHYIVGTSEHGAQWIDISTNEIVEAGIVDKNILYRGNTPLVEVDGGYLAITHKVDLTTKVKTYTNYLVKYGNDLSVQWISRPFKLTNSEIEFVTVMQIVDDEILIGVTANDETPMLFRFNKAEFMNLVNM